MPLPSELERSLTGCPAEPTLHARDSMNFRLGKLTTHRQKTVKTTVLDLQLDPAHAAPKFHEIAIEGSNHLGCKNLGLRLF